MSMTAAAASSRPCSDQITTATTATTFTSISPVTAATVWCGSASERRPRSGEGQATLRLAERPATRGDGVGPPPAAGGCGQLNHFGQPSIKEIRQSDPQPSSVKFIKIVVPRTRTEERVDTRYQLIAVRSDADNAHRRKKPRAQVYTIAALVSAPDRKST